MLIYPNCKINLGLYITGKRADGFHNLETVFYPIPLNDALEIITTHDATSLNTSGIQILSEQKDNLCIKAYELLKKSHNIGNVKIHLHKNIPVGSGLGGGSSDATHTLILLDKIFKLNLTKADYFHYAKQLGSDCSFFVENKPKLAFEKGDVFEDINLSLKGLYLMLIVPPVTVSTAEAYSMIKPQEKATSLKNILMRSVEQWKNDLINDFEKPIFEKYPVIAHIKNALYDSGAVYASMSGSGSSVYGLFKSKPTLLKWENYLTWNCKCKI